MKHFLSITLLSLFIALAARATGFVTVRGNNFITPTGTPYYYVGTNMWYAPLLADKHIKDGRKRLKEELTTLQEMGVTVVRIDVETSALTTADTLTAPMHYLLREMEQRDLKAIVCLRHIESPEALSKLAEYKDETAIMAWEIAVSANTNRNALAQQASEAAKAIKSAAPNHLVAVSLEDATGREADFRLYERLLQQPSVDFVSTDLWPVKWGWSTRSALYTTLPNVYLKAADYLTGLERLAMRYSKPLVIGAFAYPRELNHTEVGTYTPSRDAFFNFVLNRLDDSHNKRGILAGASFYGWGGQGRSTAAEAPLSTTLLADRPTEPQGRLSVYDSDSTTIALVRKYATLH